MYVQVDAPVADGVRTALQAVPGVTDVSAADTRGAVTSFEVSSESGRDVRRELASAIVSRGWGLLELRPLRMSLEEIFLHLTTEDTTASTTADIAPDISADTTEEVAQ
jgi:ABC-2 type transport system ATP-binding protein